MLRRYEHFEEGAEPTVRLKPKQMRMDMELVVPEEPRGEWNYDPDAVHGMPLRGPNGTGVAPRDFSRHGIRRHITSSLVPTRTHMAYAPPNYAVGVYRDGADGGQLHLTPIHEASKNSLPVPAPSTLLPLWSHTPAWRCCSQVLQLRPSFEHHRPKGDNTDDAEEDEDKPKKVKQEPTSVTVQVKKEMTERQTEYKLNSHQYQKQLAESEPWKNLSFYDESRPESQEVFDKLFVHHAAALNFDVSSESYLPLLTKAGSAKGSEDPDPAPGAHREPVPMSALAGLTQEGWIISVLRLAQVMAPWKLFALAEEAQTKLSKEELVVAVSQVAVLVRGNWVLRSEHYYEHGDEARVQGRDAVLRAFSKSRKVYREALCKEEQAANNLEALQLTPILEQIGFLRKNPVKAGVTHFGAQPFGEAEGAAKAGPQAWELKIKDDDELAETHTEVAAQISAGGARWVKAQGLAPEPRKKVVAKATLSEGAAEFMTLLLDVEGRWLTFEEIALKLEQSVAEADAELHEELEDLSNPALLGKALEEVAGLVQGVYVIRGVPPSLAKSKTDAQHARYWGVLMAAFAKKKVLKKTEINLVCEESIGEKEIPQAAYTKFIKRFAVNKGASWTFRAGMAW